MSGLDVEALLDSTAAVATSNPFKKEGAHSKDREDHHRGDRHDRERHRDRSRDRDRERRHRDRSSVKVKKEKDPDGDIAMESPRSERANGHKTKRRSRSRDSDRRHSRRHRDSADLEDRRGSTGDYYRGGGRYRSRSRSPRDDRYYRPGGRPRRDEEEAPRDRSPRRERRKRTPSPKLKSSTPQLTEDERDRRTVFVQQLAARLRTKELIGFFEKVGPVKEAQIVKDRVSGRSKGYVLHPCFTHVQC